MQKQTKVLNVYKKALPLLVSIVIFLTSVASMSATRIHAEESLLSDENILFLQEVQEEVEAQGEIDQEVTQIISVEETQDTQEQENREETKIPEAEESVVEGNSLPAPAMPEYSEDAIEPQPFVDNITEELPEEQRDTEEVNGEVPVSLEGMELIPEYTPEYTQEENPDANVGWSEEENNQTYDEPAYEQDENNVLPTDPWVTEDTRNGVSDATVPEGTIGVIEEPAAEPATETPLPVFQVTATSGREIITYDYNPVCTEEQEEYLQILGAIFGNSEKVFSLWYPAQEYQPTDEEIIAWPVTIPKIETTCLYHVLAAEEAQEHLQTTETAIYSKIVAVNGIEYILYFEPLFYNYEETAQAAAFRTKGLGTFVFASDEVLLQSEQLLPEVPDIWENSEIWEESAEPSETGSSEIIMLNDDMEEPAMLSDDTEESEAEQNIFYMNDSGNKQASNSGTEDEVPEEPEEETRLEQETKEDTVDTETVQTEIITKDEEIPRRRVYEYDDSHIHVTAELQDAAAVPDNAELHVSPVFMYTKGHNYQAYLDALNETSEEEKEYTAENTLLYDISFLVPIVLEDGTIENREYEPTNGEVRVSMEFKQNQLTSEINAEDESKVEVIHVGTSTGEISLNPEVIPAEVSVANEETVVFNTESFSVYAISYTVDFLYGIEGQEYSFSIIGGSAISFGELLDSMNIWEMMPEGTKREKFLKDITNISFSNPEYLFIWQADETTTVREILERFALVCEYSSDMTEEKISRFNNLPVHEGEWILISRQAFSSEETMTISLKNGESFTIQVTDAQIFQHVITADGENYKVTVTFQEDTNIPANAVLDVNEIKETDAEYGSYLSRIQEETDLVLQENTYARLFDITIRNQAGEAVQPAEGTQVQVAVELQDRAEEQLETDFQVAHFGDTLDIVENVESQGRQVSFQADAFSVYAILDSVPIENPPYALDVSELDGNTFLLSVTKDGSSKAFYFRDYIANNNKIAKTTANNRATAAQWSFELVPGETNQFYIYTELTPGERTYMNMTKNKNNASNGDMSLSTIDKTIFTVEPFDTDTPGKYYIYYQLGNTKYGLNMFGGESGQGFAGWSGKDDGSGIMIHTQLPEPDDPFQLNGKTYALINYKTGTRGVAMMSDEQNSGTRLTALETKLRTNPMEPSRELSVPQDADLTLWTFHNVTKSQYYITTEVEGATKYLKVTSAAVMLVDQPDNDCLLTLTAGTGTYQGKIRIKNSANYAPNLYSGKAANGFGSYNDSKENEWFNLAELTGLSMEDFVPYVATKVSVSDPVNVPDGAQVVVYTRIWNPTTNKYELFIVDYQGNLIPAYESGDTIEWIGLQVNTALWDFTEYYYEGTSTPNYYYELQNTYSEQYFAPSLSSGETLGSGKIGINMNGRRYGDYYSSIIAWDDAYYAYAGYKAAGGKIQSCPLSQASDFYFAIMTPTVADQLTTVNTINNDDFGITMKMIDYNGQKTNQGKYDSTQTAVVGTTGNQAGLMSNTLDSRGYPEATLTGRSLEELYTGATDVNHLFVESTYQQSGYFEFNSTSNFAHLNQNGDFTVYSQLGTIETSNQSLEHGQFMPYNTLTPGVFSTMHSNTTDLKDKALPDTNPRKGEALYAIPYNSSKAEGEDNNANYHFGMQMEAHFTQTADGLDAWGHDIIFEFAGDDDMWFYVDDQLILDLGGNHAAMSGSINFSTGQVISDRGNSTLYALFEANYRDNNQNATNEEVQEYLDGIFQLNKNGKYVFRDYTPHKMTMFYMERGAGASNLYMRFNLASVRPGSVVLKKEISGTDKPDYNLAEFPFQIFYQTSSADVYLPMTNIVDDQFAVLYNGTNIPVDYAAHYTPIGQTNGYDHVFFLKPEEEMIINFPDDTIDYYIVECGIDNDIYDEVSVNGTAVTGTDGNQDGLYDYAIPTADVSERPSVVYDNHVSPDMIRTLEIKKILYAEDGTTVLTREDDSAEFGFRLYLGSPESSEPTLAYMQEYYIKDENGNYCTYSPAQQKFVSLGKTNFTQLTAAEKESAKFVSSANGSISRIPAGYRVEVRDLLVGTKFKVEERENEIPLGYKWLRYNRVAGSYIVEDGDTLNSGIIRENSNPVIEVHNKRGFGITVEKVWSDADFMYSHSPLYFAVYVGNSATPIAIRELQNGETSSYFYFDNLETGMTFSDYVVKEVVLEDPVVGADGYVTSYTSITPVAQNGIIHVDGKLDMASAVETYSYKVQYQQGTAIGTSSTKNVRTDTVHNSRSGIRFIKTDWTGTPLEGGTYVLKDSHEASVGAPSYTAGMDGAITTAYLADGDYTFTETISPAGYAGLTDPVSLHVADGVVTVSTGTDDTGAVVVSTSGDEQIITVKNKEYHITISKRNNGDTISLEGVHFALYKQVMDGNGQPRKNYYPVAGFEDVVSGTNGTISGPWDQLPKGTYYLEEKSTIAPYVTLDYDIILTITDEGKLESEQGDSHEVVITDNGSTLAYILTVYNGRYVDVKFRKVDSENHSTALEDAVFDLYEVENGVRAETALYTGLTSNASGFLLNGTKDTLRLPEGVYDLVETQAPEYYNTRMIAPRLTITPSTVLYTEGTNSFTPAEALTYDSTEDVYTAMVSNTLDTGTGYSLSVGKQVAGSMGNRTEQFTFTLTMPQGGPNGITYTKGTNTGTVVWTNNSYTFALSHGESIVFSDIPAGTSYIVEENAANQNGYVTTVSGQSTGMLSANTTVSFTNTRNVAIPTELFDNKWTFVIAGAVICSGIVALSVKRKKKKQDENQ